MNKIIAVMIVAIAIIICFGACTAKDDKVVKVPATKVVEKEAKTTKPEASPAFVKNSGEVKPEMWTIGVGEIQRCGDSLSVSITVREITDKEVNGYSYPANKMLMVGLADGHSSTFLPNCIFEQKETRSLYYKDFFKEYNPINKLDKIVNVYMVVQDEDGNTVWESNPQPFAIK